LDGRIEVRIANRICRMEVHIVRGMDRIRGSGNGSDKGSDRYVQIVPGGRRKQVGWTGLEVQYGNK
jgi:hypothetical protein